MNTREGYSMQADVTLGVIIAALAPSFGAAIIILFCLQSYVFLHSGQYNCIIDTYNRMLHKKEKSVFRYTLSAALSTYACILPTRYAPAHNLLHAACPLHHPFHSHYIDTYQYSGRWSGREVSIGAACSRTGSTSAALMQKKDADCNQFFDVFDALPLFISGGTIIKRRTQDDGN
jgi:hypothetical protein